jgi:hypothetical protein
MEGGMMRYQVTEQANGKFSLYTDTSPETSMADEELLFWDLSEDRADELLQKYTKDAT